MHKKEECYQRLKLAREERALKEQYALRKLGGDAAADVRTTVSNVVETTSTLPDRAGYAVMAFGAKTDYGSGARCFDLVPEPLVGFCESTLGMSPSLLDPP